MSNQKITSNTFEIGPKMKVAADRKSGTRVISFPFDFPSEDQGVLIICRVKDEEWTPFTDIKSITIEFK